MADAGANMRGGSLRRRLRYAARRQTPAPEAAAGGATCRYLAIIMDGNGRWARRRHLPVAAGHRAGAKALRRVLEHALDLGILETTVYSFSTENWQRPAAEVAALMDLFVEMIESQVPDMHERGARVRFIGRRSGVSEELLARIEAAETLTAANERMTLYIAFNYGGRAELVDAAAAAAAAGEVSEASLAAHLYAPEMHDPELLIRTSGEQRISNFLLWQCAYAELYFSDKLWPDFDEADLDAALAEYARRQRRFGGR
jgi:undecaprenyl diphosphate synthase